MKTTVIYASNTGAKLDSNVYSGGGTDDTAVLQAILDLAADGTQAVCLIMDGAALVTGLNVYSNTTIRCLSNACGFYLADHSDRAIIQNVHRVTEGEILDRYITLEGGTYNQNCPNQKHSVFYYDDTGYGKLDEGEYKSCAMVVDLLFVGVEHLTLKGITIRDQRTFAGLFINWKHIVCEDVFIDLPNKVHGQNQDGLHFLGPGQYLTMRNIRGCSSDDFIALAPDEMDNHSSITDVLIDGVELQDADQGIRMLCCHKGRLDRVLVKNITGTYRSFGFFINPFKEIGVVEGAGYGNIIIDTVNLRSNGIDYDYTAPFLFRVGGHVEALTLRNIQHINPQDSRYLLDIGLRYCEDHRQPPEWDPETIVESLVLDGLSTMENDERSMKTEYIRVHSGRVKSLSISNVSINRTGDCQRGGCVMHICEPAKVENLTISNVHANGVDTFMRDESDKTGCVNLSNVLIKNDN